MTHELPQNICQEIDKFLSKYPAGQRQSAVISALMLVQKHNKGWLTDELLSQVADYIQMPKIAVYEVASFYSMFEMQPVGKYKISVCTNVSCMLLGSDAIVDHLCKKLQINFGETTKSGKFTLKQVECLAACGGAPMMQIGDEYYLNLTPEKIDSIIAGLE